jgi:predicted DNA-binding transcriptional regulator YafY
MPHQATHLILRRLHRIGHTLRQGRAVTSTRLSQIERVDRRTIRRDIAFLRSLGWRIDSTPEGYLLQSDNRALLRSA